MSSLSQHQQAEHWRDREHNGATLQGMGCTSSSVRRVGDGFCQCGVDRRMFDTDPLTTNLPLFSAGSDRILLQRSKAGEGRDDSKLTIVGVVELRPDLQSHPRPILLLLGHAYLLSQRQAGTLGLARRHPTPAVRTEYVRTITRIIVISSLRCCQPHGKSAERRAL